MKKNLLIICLIIFSNLLFAQNILEIPATKTKDAINCPMEGNPKDGSKKVFYESKNKLKNRYIPPVAKDFNKSITLEKMIGDGEPDINKFKENMAGTIEGYIVYVSPSGWAESCNCGTTLSNYSDIHIELAESPDEEKGGRTIVVELTPRIRLKDTNKWSRKELNELWKKRMPVSVSGWLFYDKEHEPQSRNIMGEECEKFANRRQTCWEIHPITNIEILKNSLEKKKGNLNDSLPQTYNTSNDRYVCVDVKKTEDLNWMDFLKSFFQLLIGLIGVSILVLKYINQRKKESAERTIENKRNAYSEFLKDFTETAININYDKETGGIEEDRRRINARNLLLLFGNDKVVKAYNKWVEFTDENEANHGSDKDVEMFGNILIEIRKDIHGDSKVTEQEIKNLNPFYRG